MGRRDCVTETVRKAGERKENIDKHVKIKSQIKNVNKIKERL